MDSFDFFHLLANPQHIRRVEKPTNNLTSEIFSFLKQKFRMYSPNEIYQDEIMEKLENILNRLTIQSTIDDIIDKIIWNTSNSNLNEILEEN
tara:strand:- start:367 stop:642 length:276 start_codon:yes stop_codon:yes gene_type:complete